jgi:hypothetical protein
MTLARRRLIVAFAVSLLLHGTLTVAWLRTRPVSSAPSAGVPTEVDGPDDREFSMMLLEPRVIETPVPVKSAPSTPPTLPPSITHPKVDTTGHSGISQSVHSPAADVSLPKSQNSSPLHGKLKAGKSIVYVLDRSSSMGLDGRLARACDAVRASLDQLNVDCRFQIVAYNGGATSFSTQLVEATPANRERASRWLKDLVAEGRSEHRIGLREALWLHPNAVFLLTDADDVNDKEVKSIRALLREPVLLSVALFGDSRTRNTTPLRELAIEMGGDVHVLNP